MKNFFKKFTEGFKKLWFLVFIPVGMFFVSLFFNKKDKSEIKQEIKEVKKEIKEETKEIEKIEKKVEEVEKTVVEKNEELKDTIQSNLDSKEERDKEAEKFFNF